MISTTKPIGSPSSPLTSFFEAPLELLQNIADSTLGNGHEEDASKRHHTLVSVFQEMVKDTDNSFRENTSPFYSKRLIERMIPDHLKNDIITKLYSSNALSTSEAKSKNLFPAAFYHVVEAFGGAKTPAAFVHAPIEKLLGEEFVGAFAELKGDKKCLREILDEGFVGFAIQILKDDPLHLAALMGDTKKINILLNNTQKKYKNPSIPPPLDLAIYSGSLDTVKLFSDHTPSMNYAFIHSHYDHPVILAIRCGHLDIVQEFINRDRSLINIKYNDGLHLLNAAAAFGQIDIFDLLISYDPSLVNIHSWLYPALNHAADNGHIDIVKALLTKFSSLANVQDHQGQTALHQAAEEGHIDIVKALLTKFSSLANVQDHQGQTALHRAAEEGHIDAVKALLIKDPSFASIQDQQGHNALHRAAKHGHINVVKELLAQDPSLVNVQDHQGRTLLHMASEYDYIHFVGTNVFQDTTKNSHIDIVKELLTKFPFLANVQDHQGQTALHIASEYGLIGAVKELMKQFPFLINVRDQNGMTALHVAASSNRTVFGLFHDQISTHPEIVQIFIDYSINTQNLSLLWLEDNAGKTPLDYAQRNNNFEINALLNKPALKPSNNDWSCQIL